MSRIPWDWHLSENLAKPQFPEEEKEKEEEEKEEKGDLSFT